MSKAILLGVCQAGGELGLERELSWSAGAFYLCISDGIIRGGLREIADRLGVRDISTVSHGEKRVADGLREGGAEAKELKRALDKTISLIIQA